MAVNPRADPVPGHTVASWAAGTPWLLLGGLLVALAGTAAVVAAGQRPRAALGAAATVAGHGALFATALGWAGVSRRATYATLALLFVAALAVTANPRGWVAYLAPLLALGPLAVTGRLHALGLGTPCPSVALAQGAAAGAFLGGHVLVSGALTLGPRARPAIESYLSWLCFDVGVHLPASELFFRGAFFNRIQRRGSLTLALALTTASNVVRYLVDPLLPSGTEFVLGVMLYVSLLSAVSCWLFWRHGSLWPGLLASVVFFAAYRALGPP